MNSSDRLSDDIAERQMVNFVNGLAFACVRGTPPTRFCTLNAKHSEISAQKVNTAYLKQVSQFLRDNDAPRAHLWSIEHPFGGPLNIHCLIHCPPHLMEAFCEREEEWAYNAGIPREGHSRKDSLPFKGIELRGLFGTTGFYQSVENLGAYILKGGNAEACERLAIEHTPQGKVLGQRCGLSQSIDISARKRAGFQDKPLGSLDLQFPWRYMFKP